MNKNRLALILTLFSFLLLVPGIVLPIYKVTFDTQINAKLVNLDVNVLSQERSILGTVEELFKKERYLVSILILLFSVLIPFTKGVLVLMVLLKKKWDKRKKIFNFIHAIGKWSMADVYVVGVFLAFLATKDTGSLFQKEIKVLGMFIVVKMNNVMQSSLGPGFYYFLGYCLISLGAMQLLEITEGAEQPNS